jgi:CubicO group peptidase (beta-lactamase class C family)
MKHVLGMTFATCALVAAQVAYAAGLSAEQITEISRVASSTIESKRLAGLSVAVAKDDRIWSAGFGKADLEQDVPVNAQSLFRTASVAKWFTATAAMRLVERGKLDLDEPIQKYCPQFPQKQWPITTRQLMTHMAGVRHYHGSNGEKHDTEAERKALSALIERERATQYVRFTDVIKPLDAFKDDPLLFEPGTNTRYSSPGYRVVGCVVEGAAHMPFGQAMRDLVFVPAGMTTIIEDDARVVIPHRVAGYSKAPGNVIVRADYRDVSDNVPAGGYLATAEDMARFALAFRAGKLVSMQTRDLMVERPKLKDGTLAPNPAGDPPYYYGLGIMIAPGEEQPAWFHTGGQSGTTTLLFYFPKSDVVVSLMTNMDGGAIRESVAREIGAIARGK